MLRAITKQSCVLTVCFLAALAQTGCSGALSGNPPSSSDVTTQIRAGNNVPTGYVLYFQMPLSSVTLTSDKGKKVELLSEPMTVEHSHLVANEEVLTDLPLPQGTYTQADIVMQDAHLSYVDYFAQIIETDLPTPPNVHLTLNPPIVIGSDSTVISIGLDLAQTLSIDATQDTATLNAPVFTLTQETIPAPGLMAAQSRVDLAAPRDKSGAQAGAVGNVFGTVKSVSGTYLTVLNASTGSLLTMNTDQGTVFEGSGLATLQGMMVEVEVVTQTDGTLLAEEVEALGDGSGSALLGVVTSVANMSAGTTAQAELGAGLTPGVLGQTVIADVSRAGTYKVDTAGIDMTGLTFTFSRPTFVPGQRVDLVSTYPLQPDPNGFAGILLVDTVELEQQTISGAISNLSTDGSGRTVFDLVLPTDGSSMLTLLGPVANQPHIVLQSATVVAGQLTNGRQVSVRGLLFHNVLQTGAVRPNATPPGMEARYVMVASQIQ